MFAKIKSILAIILISCAFGQAGAKTQNISEPIQPAQVLGAFDQKISGVHLDDFENKAAPSLLSISQTKFNPAPVLSSRAALVYSLGSGEVLFSRNAGDRFPIASLTKIMTALVASEAPGFSTAVTISANDQLSIEPSLHLKLGDKIFPADLLRAMLIGSANDAALTLANHFPHQRDFIQAMNDKALYLNLPDTNFSTPIGFDTPGNYSSADDLEKLVNYALLNLPLQEIWQKNSYSFSSLSGNAYTIKASNDLILKHSNIHAIKTGLTPEAKGNMIVEANGSGNNEQIISIVLGSQNRDKDTLNLISYIFSNFTWSK